MADAVNRNFGSAAPSIARGWSALADWLAVAVAVALPWSTSVSQILIVAWLVALDPDARRRDDAARTAKPGRRAAGAALAAGAGRNALGERALDRALRGARRLPQAAGHSAAAGAVPPLASAACYVLYGFLASCVGAADRLVGSDRAVELLAAFTCRDKLPGMPVQGLHRAELRIPDLRVRPARARVRSLARSDASRSPPAPRCWRCLFLANIFYICARAHRARRDARCCS